MVLKFFGKRLLAENKLVGLKRFDWLVRNNVPAGFTWWGGKMYQCTQVPPHLDLQIHVSCS